METTAVQAKPWWKRSENFIGAPVVGLLLTGLFTFVGITIAPYIILAATNMLYMGFLLIATIGIGVTLLNKDFQTGVYYAWKSLTKAIGWAIINQDPVGVVETSISRGQGTLDEMLSGKGDCGGQILGLNNDIKSNSDRAELDRKKAVQAEKQGDLQSTNLFAAEAQDLDNANKNLIATRDQIQMIYDVLEDMCSTVDFNLKRMRSQLEIKKRERKAIMAAHSAISKGWKIISGRSADSEMFNKGMESIAETINRQTADIDVLKKDAFSIIRGVDLERGVIQEDALKALQAWKNNKRLGSLARSPDSQQVIDVTPAPKQLSQPGKSKFSNILNKN